MPSVDDLENVDVEAVIQCAAECWNQGEYDRTLAELAVVYKYADQKALARGAEKDLSRLCIVIATQLASEKRLDELLAFSENALAVEVIRKNTKIVATLYSSIANSYYALQMFEEAIKYYDLALNLKKDQAQYDSFKYVFMGKMNALRKLNRIDEAIAELKQLCGSSTGANDHLVLAQFYEIAGKLEEAIDEYRTVLHLSPENEMAYVRLKSLGINPADDRQRVIVTREIVRVPCPYCSTLVENTALKCPNCGAPQRR